VGSGESEGGGAAEREARRKESTPVARGAELWQSGETSFLSGEGTMDLFGLHISRVFVTVVTVLYWIAVVIGLLACVRRGYLRGKWRWYLLSLSMTCAATSLVHFSISAEISMTLVMVFMLGKWRKITFSPLEWLLMAMFVYPAIFSVCVALLVIWVEVLRLPV